MAGFTAGFETGKITLKPKESTTGAGKATKKEVTGEKGGTDMDLINSFLETLKQGGKQSHLNLAMIPLLSSNGGEPDYLTLEEGLIQNNVIITEISTGGSVPELKLINKSSDES